MDSILEIEDLLTKWKSIRRTVVKPLEKNIAYRPMFNVDFFREAVLYRFIELAESTILLFKENYLIGAIISVRSVQETVAVLWYLNENLKFLSKTKDLRTFLKKIYRLSLGWSGVDEFPEKINILNCIDSVDKMMDGSFRKGYDVLSEYAHPNYSGVIGAYTQPNQESLDVKFSYYPRFRDQMKEMVISTLSASLMLLEPITETYEAYLNKCQDVCHDLHEQGELKEIFYQKT